MFAAAPESATRPLFADTVTVAPLRPEAERRASATWSASAWSSGLLAAVWIGLPSPIGVTGAVLYDVRFASWWWNQAACAGSVKAAATAARPQRIRVFMACSFRRVYMRRET